MTDCSGKKYLLWIRLLVSASLLVWLLTSIEWTQVAELAGKASMAWLLAALAGIVLSVLVSVLKWSLLCHACGLQVPPDILWNCYWAGLFFNNFLPSSMGGDALRIYWAGKYSKNLPGAAASVVVERILATTGLSVLALLAKAPVPGLTKTRLIGKLSAVECAAFHMACLMDACQTVREAGAEGYLYTTEQNLRYFKKEYFMDLGYPELGLPAEHLAYFHTCLQAGDNLGQRMYNIYHELLQVHDRVVIIGSDIPGLTAADLAESLHKLDGYDLVLGPAQDGGYYLIGAKKAYGELFKDIPWGTYKVLEKTIACAEAKELAVFLHKPKRDIDTWEDLRAYYKDAMSVVPSSPRESHVAKLLECWFARDTSSLASGG